jgi:hypothetical protein
MRIDSICFDGEQVTLPFFLFIQPLMLDWTVDSKWSNKYLTHSLRFIPDTFFTVLAWHRTTIPWTDSTRIDEKLRFVFRFLDAEAISVMCRSWCGSGIATAGYRTDETQPHHRPVTRHPRFRPFKRTSPACKPCARYALISVGCALSDWLVI